MRNEILERLASEGVLLEPDAAQMVLGKENPLEFIHNALASMEQQPLVVTLQDLLGDDGASITSCTPTPSPIPRPIQGREVRVLKDITGNSTCEGNIIDFARCFDDRFKKVKKMLAHRRELAGCIPISRALKLGREVRMVAIVNEIRATKNGHRILEVEDEEDKCAVLILKDSPLIQESIVPDEVIGIVGKTSKKGDMVVMDELIRPELPLRGGMEPSDSSSSVAFLSDIHVGSNTFLERQWNNMIHWLKTEGRDEIQYIVVPGDCVDGIGIFPGQEEELLIDDIFQQYEALNNLFKSIPDGMKLVVLPGNHDAVRPAEPQPTFPQQITSMFDSQVLFVGNPCYLEIEGRKILAYHGRSMDDWMGTVQTLNYNNPLEAMREMLRRRHLAPIYGGKTPIAPEKEDYMVIEEVPDIFVTGHVHGAGISEYRGVKTICASTWQSQTAFQRMHNFNPDPAKMPVVHLGTGKSRLLDFNDPSYN